MHPIKLLVKATAGTGLKTGGSGGKPLFDSVDAAHALAGLDPILSSIAYYRFCGDDSQLNKVKGNLFVKAMRLARENNYKIKKTTLSGLCDAALKQDAMPICLKCDGMAVMRVPGREEPHVCGYCSGTGQKQLTYQDVADCCRVSRKAIKHPHRAILKALVEYLRDSEIAIINHVREQMI